MSEIVQYQYHLLITYVIETLLLRVSVLVELETESIRDSDHERIWQRLRRRCHEVDTLREIVQVLGSSVNRKPRFANAARTDHCQAAASRIAEKTCNLSKRFLPAKE